MPQDYQPFYSIARGTTTSTVGSPADIGASTEDMAMQITITGNVTVLVKGSQNNIDWENVSDPPAGYTASTIIMLDRRVAFYRADATVVAGTVEAIVGYGRGRHGELLNAGPTTTPTGFAIGQIDVSGLLSSAHQITAALPIRVNGGGSTDMTTSPTAFTFVTNGVTNRGIVVYDAVTGGYKVQVSTLDDGGTATVTRLLATVTGAFGAIVGTALSSGGVGVGGVASDNAGIEGDATTGTGVAGYATGLNGIGVTGRSIAGMSGFFQSSNNGNLQPTLMSQQQGASTAPLFVTAPDAGGANFRVSSDGDLSMIKSVVLSWPGANAAGGLTNDGAGNLSWAAAAAAVLLQGSTPGAAQTGHINVSGTIVSARVLSTVTGAFVAILGTANSSGGVGVSGVASDNAGVEGDATTGAGVKGLATGTAGIGVSGGSAAGISGWFQSTSNGNTQPTLVAQQQGAATAPLIVAEDNAGGAVWRVGSDGDLSMVKGVALAWPAANAAGALTNNGAGSLSWTAGGGATLAQAKLAGRGSASGSGVYEEIALGTGLSISATTLNGAPTATPYVTTAADAGLSAEKVLPYLGNYNPLVPPGSPSGTNDEFDDGAIGGAWTVDGSPDTASESTYPGYLFLADNDAAAAGYYIGYTPGAATLTVAARMTFDVSLASTNYCGIFLADSGGTALATLSVQRGSGVLQTRHGATGGSNTTLSAAAYSYFGYIDTIYLMIQRDATTNYTALVSKDGISWASVGTWSQAGTIARAYLTVFGASSTNTSAWFDFIRMFTSQTTIIGAAP